MNKPSLMTLDDLYDMIDLCDKRIKEAGQPVGISPLELGRGQATEQEELSAKLGFIEESLKEITQELVELFDCRFDLKNILPDTVFFIEMTDRSREHLILMKINMEKTLNLMESFIEYLDANNGRNSIARDDPNGASSKRMSDIEGQ